MIKNYFKREKELIDSQLDRLLPKADVQPNTLHRAMRYSVFSGGKRLRPIMAIEACKLCGGRITDIIKAACAIEMVHAYSLIHDDLPSMDNDNYRRGKPSCHKKFGEATAILAGDGLLTQAFRVLGETRRAEGVNRAVKELSREIGSLGMVGGQEVDLRKKNTRDKNDLRFIAENKTASLFKASMVLGAIFSGADRRKEEALSRFGRYFGRAFQLADDTFDNDGYARIIGREKAWAKAKEFIKKAKDELRPFGKKAERLKVIADFVISKKQ